MSPNLSFIVFGLLRLVFYLMLEINHPFSDRKKKKVLASAIISGAEFNYTHISLSVFLLLIVKVPVYQKKREGG